MTARYRVRGVEPRALVASPKPPRGRCHVGRERAWPSGEFIAKEIQVAGPNSSRDPSQGVCRLPGHGGDTRRKRLKGTRHGRGRLDRFGVRVQFERQLT